MAVAFKQVALLKGLGLHIADINILSGATVPFANLHPAEPIQVNDTIIDSNGDAYTVATVGADNVTVGNAVQGVSFRGPAGAQGAGLTLKGSVASADQLPADNNAAGDSYLVAGHLYTWDGKQWVDGGNIQGPSGEGYHTAAAALADDGKVAIADLVPNTSVTVGDSVVDSNGDVREIVATDDTNATLGKKIISLKGAAGAPGEKGDPGAKGADGANGASYRVASAAPDENKQVSADAILPAGAAVGDTVLLPDGTVASITAVADGKATLSDPVAGVSLKGEKGDTGVTSATATALAADAKPTAAVDAKGVLALGIPAGAKGDKGDPGAAGQRGSLWTSVEDTSTLTGVQVGDVNLNPTTSVLSIAYDDGK